MKYYTLFIICFLSMYSACAPDLTLVGVISPATIGKLPSLWIEHFASTYTLNFIPTAYCDMRSASPLVAKIAAKKNTTPGSVALLLETLWYTFKNPSQFMPASPIKLAYTMIESTKIPHQWVTILNNHFDAAILPDACLKPIYKRCGVKIPLFVIPCGLNLEPFLSEPLTKHPGTPFTFGMSGAFWSRKNHHIVLKAFARAFGNKTDVRLILHGRGGETEIINSLHQIIRAYGLTNVSIYNKLLDDTAYRNFLKSLDCYILISKGEGYSISPREALALGIPCIISDALAHATLCKSGYVRTVKASGIERAHYQREFGIADCGYQYTYTTEQVKQALEDVYTHYAHYAAKAKIARDWVKQYTFGALSAYYKNLIKPKRVVYGPYNTITKDFMMTNSPRLYAKYRSLCTRY